MKRRRRSRRPKHGVYVSTRTGDACRYRSGWEREYMEHLDQDPTVAVWAYEPLEIPYVSAPRSGRVRRYVPDFVVERVDGSRAVVEVKPSSRVDRPTNVKKFAAARAWCARQGAEFIIVTEVELRALGLLGRRERP